MSLSPTFHHCCQYNKSHSSWLLKKIYVPFIRFRVLVMYYDTKVERGVSFTTARGSLFSKKKLHKATGHLSGSLVDAHIFGLTLRTSRGLAPSRDLVWRSFSCKYSRLISVFNVMAPQHRLRCSVIPPLIPKCTVLLNHTVFRTDVGLCGSSCFNL